MIKLAFFPSMAANGPAAVPLFTRETDSFLEKTAAPDLLPEVVRYIATLKPQDDSQYVLLNAMGAGEWWGSNINGDYFPEAALIHAPDNWTGKPVIDRIRAKTWPYGYPTFYDAHPFAHHRNKDPEKAFGEVELAAWNDKMKRVELVARVDRDKCAAHGGQGVWDKLKIGGFPDVSMGCKVPFDTCSICLDWEMYKKAQELFVKGKHKHPGEAVLAYHRSTQTRKVDKEGKVTWEGKGKIRGLSVTRADYCAHALKSMNEILPDGRKVFVYNDYPKFFDISFVFIGADKTAKVMLKIASNRSYFFLSGAEAGETVYEQGDSTSEKLTAVQDATLKVALAKDAKDKAGEITKDVFPSQFASKAIPVMTKHEPSIPDDLLDLLGSRPLGESLSTVTGMGMVLRPREFQRIILINSGAKPMADHLDEVGMTFPKVDESEEMPMASGGFNAALAKLLLPLFGDRSGFGPAVEKRVIILLGRGEPEKASATKSKAASSLSPEVLRKIGAAYNSYRQNVMNLIPESQSMLSQSGLRDMDLAKVASAPVGKLFTPLSAAYFKLAFQDEVGSFPATGAGVERGYPSKNTFSKTNH
jgi:hypothetical protein